MEGNTYDEDVIHHIRDSFRILHVLAEGGKEIDAAGAGDVADIAVLRYQDLVSYEQDFGGGEVDSHCLEAKCLLAAIALVANTAAGNVSGCYGAYSAKGDPFKDAESIWLDTLDILLRNTQGRLSTWLGEIELAGLEVA